jgi:hypothetical protein
VQEDAGKRELAFHFWVQRQ